MKEIKMWSLAFTYVGCFLGAGFISGQELWQFFGNFGNWGYVGLAGAAVLSIVCSFIGKFSTLISTIPGPVIGGISFLLYGMIGTSGLRILVDSRVDYGNSRNLALTSVIFVTGLSGIAVKFGNVQLTGMVLACVVGMILSLVFYVLDYFKLTNDQ